MSSNSTTMPQVVKLAPWKTGAELEFKNAKDLADWARSQATAWEEMPSPSNNIIREPWNNQRSWLQNLASHSENLISILEKTEDEQVRQNAMRDFFNNMNGVINNINSGLVITTENSDFLHIKALAKRDAEAAGLLLLTSLNEANYGNVIMQALNNQRLASVLFRSAILPTKKAPGYAESMKTFTDQAAHLTGGLVEELETHRKINEDWKEFLPNAKKEAELASGENLKAWQDWLKERHDQWEARLRAYDEKMAFAAPVTYWEGRRKSSRRAAITYAILFLIAAGIPLRLFVIYGIPHLTGIAGDKEASLIAGILPILFPAFVCIWALRILGRLLAENIQLMQDASERVTMVKTFLALMNDEIRGKAIITEADRVLILPAIFRPSSITAADDAPPVHYLELFTKKFGGASGNKAG